MIFAKVRRLTIGNRLAWGAETGSTMLQPSEKRPPNPIEIDSACCRYCRGTARLIRREPVAAGVEGELLTFECEKCGEQPKAIVQV